MDALASALKEFSSISQALGPWGVVFFLWWQGQKESKKWEERFIAVQRMYENNVELVRDYNRLSCDQQNLIIMNTQAITELGTILKARE